MCIICTEEYFNGVSSKSEGVTLELFWKRADMTWNDLALVGHNELSILICLPCWHPENSDPTCCNHYTVTFVPGLCTHGGHDQTRNNKHVRWRPGYVPLSLLSMHSFTGCDIIFSFGRKGKGVAPSLYLGGKARVWHCLIIWEVKQEDHMDSWFHLLQTFRRRGGCPCPSVTK